MKWEKRFWSKVDIQGPNDCWPWTGAISKNGYGSFKLEGSAQTTSRIAYRLANANVSRGLMVLHTCDNRACCNPSHLYLGNAKQNARDMVERGRASHRSQKGAANGNAKLSEDDVAEIRRLIQSGRRNTDIGLRFKVSHQIISKIRRGSAWGLPHA